MSKHYVYSARTTEKGLALLNKTKGNDKSWDTFINEAVAAHYNLPLDVIALPPSQFLAEQKAKREAKEAEKAQRKAEREATAKAKADEKAKADKAKAAEKAKADKEKAKAKAKAEADKAKAKAKADAKKAPKTTEPQPEVTETPDTAETTEQTNS